MFGIAVNFQFLLVEKLVWTKPAFKFFVFSALNSLVPPEVVLHRIRSVAPLADEQL